MIQHASILHLANHQHRLSACCPHQSIMLLPQLSFLLHNVVLFIFMIRVTIQCVCMYSCDEMHHLFVPIINTLCVCHFGPIQCGHHLCFGVLAVMPFVHHKIALYMCTFALQIQHKRAEEVAKTPPIQLAS